MAKMNSLEMTAAEVKEDSPFLDKEDLKNAPKFPRGAKLHLNNLILKKLGMKAGDFEVKGRISITAEAVVTEIENIVRIGDEPRMHVDLQIVGMKVEADGKELSDAEELFGKNG